jgi:16S rRNA (guanine527-N7)-methyltransferase
MTIPENNSIRELLLPWIRLFQLNDQQIQLVIQYIQFLMKKNQELNLISRKMDLKTLIDDHIADCLSGNVFFRDCKSVTDIGSGGGLPGLLLAIMNPELSFTLVDKSPKKTDFLKAASGHLQLRNVKVVCTELTQFKPESDCITCRAFKPLDVILDLTRSFFSSGKPYILYKGRMSTIQEEIKSAMKKYQFIYEMTPLDIYSDKERHIVLIHKN